MSATDRARLLAMLARGCFLPEARAHALLMLAIDDRRRACYKVAA